MPSSTMIITEVKVNIMMEKKNDPEMHLHTTRACGEREKKTKKGEGQTFFQSNRLFLFFSTFRFIEIVDDSLGVSEMEEMVSIFLISFKRTSFALVSGKLLP